MNDIVQYEDNSFSSRIADELWTGSVIPASGNACRRRFAQGLVSCLVSSLVMPVAASANDGGGRDAPTLTARSGEVAVSTSQQPQSQGVSAHSDLTAEESERLNKATFGRDPQHFARFDELEELGVTTSYPGNMDTILGDANGWRSALRDRDVYIQAWSAPSVSWDALGKSKDLPVAFHGQKPTVVAAGVSAKVNVGLRFLGLPNSYIGLGGYAYPLNSNRPELYGPRHVYGFRSLYYAQAFEDDRLLVKVGYFPTFYDFVGQFAGGNPILTSGVGALIPVAAGLSVEPETAPAIELAYTADNGMYLKGSVQRSTSPRGYADELSRAGSGLEFDGADGAKALYIGEIGLRRKATATQRQIWIRAGLIYNRSRFARFDGGYGKNVAGYLLADHQLLKTDRLLPFRGIYVGVSGLWADPKVTYQTQAYEARIYAVGPFAARPTDAINFTVAFNRFSRDLQGALAQGGQPTHSSQIAVGINYASHVSAGIYVVPQITFTNHPNISKKYGSSLTIGGGLVFNY